LNKNNKKQQGKEILNKNRDKNVFIISELLKKTINKSFVLF